MKDMIRSWGMFLFVSFFLAGCSYQPFSSIGQIKKGIETKAIQRRLEEGNRFFQEGKYREAEKVFESLRHIENPLAVRQAVYGLACTRLRLAENRKQYLEAAKLLDQWRRISPVSLSLEDPECCFHLFLKRCFPNPVACRGGRRYCFRRKSRF